MDNLTDFKVFKHTRFFYFNAGAELRDLVYTGRFLSHFNKACKLYVQRLFHSFFLCATFWLSEISLHIHNVQGKLY